MHRYRLIFVAKLVELCYIYIVSSDTDRLNNEQRYLRDIGNEIISFFIVKPLDFTFHALLSNWVYSNVRIVASTGLFFFEIKKAIRLNSL